MICARSPANCQSLQRPCEILRKDSSHETDNIAYTIDFLESCDAISVTLESTLEMPNIVH
jgi:hypothetical protein